MHITGRKSFATITTNTQNTTPLLKVFRISMLTAPSTSFWNRAALEFIPCYLIIIDMFVTKSPNRLYRKSKLKSMLSIWKETSYLDRFLTFIFGTVPIQEGGKWASMLAVKNNQKDTKLTNFTTSLQSLKTSNIFCSLADKLKEKSFPRDNNPMLIQYNSEELT